MLDTESDFKFFSIESVQNYTLVKVKGRFLMKLIPIIQKINRIKRDISENQTLISTILPVFRYLGWDIFNENRVIFEDVTSTKKRVDLTFVFDNESKFIIEAKRLSHKLSIKDFEQLTVYLNSDDTVNFGILTNGTDYIIADNKGEGLDGKRIYGFNIFDITECDIQILKLFFSFKAPYKFKDLKKYIRYIQMGVEFGDKKCDKVLEIENFEAEKEVIPKSLKELQVEKNITKPNFETTNINKPEIIQNFEKPLILKEINTVSDKNPIEKKSISTDLEETSQKYKVETKRVVEGEKIEFFELIERNKAKIFINGEYHILQDENFSSLFIQMLKYALKKIASYPTLFNKIADEFDFLFDEQSKPSNSGDYQEIADNIFFNINTNNYTKLKNIEAILRFADTNQE